MYVEKYHCKFVNKMSQFMKMKHPEGIHTPHSSCHSFTIPFTLWSSYTHTHLTHYKHTNTYICSHGGQGYGCVIWTFIPTYTHTHIPQDPTHLSTEFEISFCTNTQISTIHIILQWNFHFIDWRTFSAFYLKDTKGKQTLNGLKRKYYETYATINICG